MTSREHCRISYRAWLLLGLDGSGLLGLIGQLGVDGALDRLQVLLRGGVRLRSLRIVFGVLAERLRGEADGVGGSDFAELLGVSSSVMVE